MSAPGPKTMRAVERVREGESCLAAAKAEGLNVTSVWRVCKRLGIPVRRRGERATNAAAAAAAKLAHERGLNARQAAEATGASERTIYRHMHRLYGHSIRKQKPAPQKRELKPALAAAVSMVRGGATLKHAGETFAIDTSHLWRTCKRLGVPMRKPGRAGPSPATLRAVDRVRLGATLTEAAAAEGVHISSIRHAAKRLDVPMRKRGRPARDHAATERAVARVLCGESASAAARSEGVRRTTVAARVKAALAAGAVVQRDVRSVDAVAVVDDIVARLRAMDAAGPRCATPWCPRRPVGDRCRVCAAREVAA